MTTGSTINYLAIKSVFAVCKPRVIYLYVSDSLHGQPYFQRLVDEVPCLQVVSIDINALTFEAGHPARGEIVRVYNYLLENRFWGPLSDILRYLLLYLHGGIYLDMDILVIKDLSQLLDQPGCCGREHILVSGAVASGSSRLRYFRTTPLTLLRDIFARTENGVRYFKSISRFFIEAINGAVLGLKKGHPILLEALDMLPELGYQCPKRRGIIGPDLLQKLLDHKNRHDVVVYPPEYFYPLGPTMARHYFRPNKDLEKLQSRVISTDTYLVHWYNDGTNSGFPPENDDELLSRTQTQLFSKLSAALVEK